MEETACDQAEGEQKHEQTLKEKLQSRIDAAEAKLSNLKNSMALLEANPEFENFLEVLRKAHF